MQELAIMAQESIGPDAAKFLGVGMAGLGLAGAGVGLGILGAGAMNALGRNPEAENTVRPNMIVALGLTEAIGIYGFLIGLFLALGLGG